MDINQLIKEKPVVRDMADCKEIFWINPQSDKPAKLPFTMATSRTLRQDCNALHHISRRLFRKPPSPAASLNPN